MAMEVLNREALPSREGMAQRRMQAEKDIEYKMGLLKIYEGQLKNQAKSTENEAEQARLQAESDKVKTVVDVFKMAMDSSDPQGTLLTFMQMYPEIMPDLMKGGFADAIKKLQPSGKSQQEKAIADLIKAKMGGTTGNGSMGVDTESIGGNAVDQASRAAVVGGGLNDLAITKYAPTTEIVDVGESARVATAEAAGRARGTPVTGEEARIIAGAESVATSVTEALRLLNKGILDRTGSRQILDSGISKFATGDLEALMSEINNLKSMVPFAKGGKQLTPYEAKLLFRLLDTSGKTLPTIKNDLSRFAVEFKRLNQLVTTPIGEVNRGRGSQQINSDNDPLGIFE